MKAEVESSKNTRWVMRDVLTFVIFQSHHHDTYHVAKVVEDMLLAPQNTFFVGSWLFPLLATPFYLVMADRIGKRGVLSDRSSYLVSSTPSWADPTVHRSLLWAQS